MSISRYPHYGLAIAPKGLATLLDVPNTVAVSPSSLVRYPRLADLDNSVWQYLDRRECEACGDAVVSRVAAQRSSKHLLERIYFPAVHSSVTPDALEIEVRTYNCLIRASKHSRLISSLSDLQFVTVEKLLTKVRGFGMKSLVDLFVALESLPRMPQQLVSTELLPTADNGKLEGGSLSRPEIIAIISDPNRLTHPKLRSRHLPTVPATLRLDDLQLSSRSRGCLLTLFNSNRIASISDLKGYTVGELLSIPNFGRTSLLDLLHALATVLTPAADPSPLSFDGAVFLNERLTSAAERLRDARHTSRVKCSDTRLSLYLKPLWALANASIDESPLHTSAHLSSVAHRIAGRARDVAPDEAVELIRKARVALSRSLRCKLEDELRQVVSVATSGRNTEIVLQYHGWNEKGPRTLQAVGEQYGMTRERIRQIISRVAKAFQNSKPFMPILDRVCAKIGRHVPLTQSDAETMLLQSRLTAGRFHLGGVISAAEFFGKDLPFVFDSSLGVPSVLRSDQLGITNVVVRTARRLTSHFGLTTVADLSERVSQSPEALFNATFVRELLCCRGDVRWLDSARDWFWIQETPRNHLTLRIRKALSVSPRLQVSELRTIISADHRGMGYAPPTDVVIEFCRTACGCRVEGAHIVCDSPPAPAETLSPAELIQYHVLHECGPLMQRQTFERECVRRGMNVRTFSMYLARSPILARYSVGVYGLWGAEFQPGQIDELSTSQERRSWFDDHGWTPDARLWFLAELRPNTIASGVFSVPVSFRKLLEGRFLLKSDTRERLGTIVISERTCWGLTPLFTRRGGESGDFLLLVFDLRKREATARIGTDAELLIESLETSNAD